MSLSDLAAIGSFVSGIAVVVSFIFLALQIRQANRNQKSLMQQGRTARNVEILLRLSDCHASETMAAAHGNCAALSPPQIFTFYGLAGAVFWSYEDSFLQFQAGALDAGSWESDVASIRRLLRNPAYRVAWKIVREGMNGGYRDYVDSLLAEVAPDASHTITDLWNMYASEELAAR